MTYLPHVWVYAGATCEDAIELEDCGPPSLDDLSHPQLAFVAPGYSDDLVQKLAIDMWSEIQGEYEDAFGYGIGFHDLKAVMSAQIVERPNGFDGEMPVLEVTTWHYYLMHSVEPLMQVVVQKRPLKYQKLFSVGD